MRSALNGCQVLRDPPTSPVEVSASLDHSPLAAMTTYLLRLDGQGDFRWRGQLKYGSVRFSQESEQSGWTTSGHDRGESATRSGQWKEPAVIWR